MFQVKFNEFQIMYIHESNSYPYTEPDSCFSDFSDSVNSLNSLNSMKVPPHLEKTTMEMKHVLVAAKLEKNRHNE